MEMEGNLTAMLRNAPNPARDGEGRETARQFGILQAGILLVRVLWSCQIKNRSMNRVRFHWAVDLAGTIRQIKTGMEAIPKAKLTDATNPGSGAR
jgi:hypothetical protein